MIDATESVTVGSITRSKISSPSISTRAVHVNSSVQPASVPMADRVMPERPQSSPTEKVGESHTITGLVLSVTSMVCSKVVTPASLSELAVNTHQSIIVNVLTIFLQKPSPPSTKNTSSSTVCTRLLHVSPDITTSPKSSSAQSTVISAGGKLMLTASISPKLNCLIQIVSVSPLIKYATSALPTLQILLISLRIMLKSISSCETAHDENTAVGILTESINASSKLSTQSKLIVNGPHSTSTLPVLSSILTVVHPKLLLPELSVARNSTICSPNEIPPASMLVISS